MPAVFSSVTIGPAAGFRFWGPDTVLLNPVGEVAMYKPPPRRTRRPNVITATLPGIRYGAMGGWAYGPRGSRPSGVGNETAGAPVAYLPSAYRPRTGTTYKLFLKSRVT